MPSLPMQVAGILTSGEAFLQKEDYSQALDLFELALATAQQNQDPEAEILALQRLGTVHHMQDQPELAISLVKQALSVALEHQNSYGLHDCHRQLAQIYKTLKAFQKALQHFDIAESLRTYILKNQIHPALYYCYPALASASASDDEVSEVNGVKPDGSKLGDPSSVLQNIPIGLYRFTLGSELIEVNSAMAQMLGFANRETFLQDHARNAEDSAAYFALEELAVRDPLTHIYNRRHFFELANREMARSHRYHRPVSLVMLDVDYFKMVNDRHGHWVGDRALQSVALLLQNNSRQSDILARYGGEKFIILMAETAQNQSWNGAERLRKLVADHHIKVGETELQVTVSAGVTSWLPEHQASPPEIDELLKQVDHSLYRAKQAGGNQTVAYSSYPVNWPDNHA